MDQQLWNNIISTSVGGAAGGAVAGLVLYGVQQAHLTLKDVLQTRKLVKWMRKNPGVGTNYRTTRAIASHNNMTEDRVRFLCSHSKHIHMSRGMNEDLWTSNKVLEDFREAQENAR